LTVEATLPKGPHPQAITVYAESGIDAIEVGKVAPGTKTKGGLAAPRKTERSAIIHGPACAPAIPIVVDGKPTGKLDTSPLERPSALGYSLFVPRSSSECYTVRDVGYGANASPKKKLAGAGAYVIDRDHIDFFLTPASTSVTEPKWVTSAYRVELVKAPCD
jgi:hypothetical protein